MWPRSGSFEFDSAGDPAIGALAYFFEAGTSTPKAVYPDAAEAENPHEHPVEADGNGRWPAVFVPFGSYKCVLKTSGGTTLFTIDQVPNAAPVEPDAGLTEDSEQVLQTGQIIFALANETVTGFVRCNGRTIGSAASSATERANADCEDLFTYIWNKSTTLRGSVSGGSGASAAADFAANKTIPLPNGLGAGLVGFDDMGASDSGNSDSAPVISGSSILAGSLIGGNTHTILEAQLPTHAHSISLTSGAGSAHTHGTGTFATVSDGAHTHPVSIPSGEGSHTHAASDSGGNFWREVGAGGGFNVGGGTNTTTQAATGTATLPAMSGTATSNGAHTHGFTGSLATESSHTHSVSGNTGNIGSGTAHNIMSRAIPVTVLIKL